MSTGNAGTEPKPPATRAGAGAPRLALFRREALAAAGAQPYGDPFGRAPVGWTVVALFLILVTAAAAGFLVTAQYARKETTFGLLRADGGETRVVAQNGGVVRALYVKDGNVVEKGQRLALISTEQVLSDGLALDQEILAGLEREEASVRARLAALTAGAPFDVAAMRADRRRLSEAHEAALAGIDNNDARLAIARQRLKGAEALSAQGYLPADLLRERQSDVLNLEAAVRQAESEAASTAAQISGIDARMAKLPHDLALSQAELAAQIANLAQTRAQIEGRKGYELLALKAGRVSALQASVGAAADPNKPLMTVTPADAALHAEIFVPSRAIGFIRPGQRVRLLYDAFPYQKFGPAWGVVRSISATVLSPQELNAATPLQEPVYRVTAALDRQTMLAFGRAAPLQSGMALTADVILESRSFAEWLLEPLYAIAGRSGLGPQRRSAAPAR